MLALQRTEHHQLASCPRPLETLIHALHRADAIEYEVISAGDHEIPEPRPLDRTACSAGHLAESAARVRGQCEIFARTEDVGDVG